MTRTGRHAEKFQTAYGYLLSPYAFLSIGIDAQFIQWVNHRMSDTGKITCGDIKFKLIYSRNFYKGKMRRGASTRQISSSAWSNRGSARLKSNLILHDELSSAGGFYEFI